MVHSKAGPGKLRRKIHTIKAKEIEGLRNQKTHACRQAEDIMFFNDRQKHCF